LTAARFWTVASLATTIFNKEGRMSRPWSTTLVVTATLAAVLIGAASPSEAAGASKGALEGSWRVTITGGTGTPPLPNWYCALVTFTHEGGLVATITDGSISTGHGAWSKVGSHEFLITIELRQFNADGSFAGTLKAPATITVNNAATEFTSDEYHFEFFDPFGHPPGSSGIGQANGTRISP
jgi:hypothetical protein